MANTETVIIPKKEYELLLKYRHIVESDFEGKFSKKLIKTVKRSEKAYKEGKFVRVKNTRERKRLFNSL